MSNIRVWVVCNNNRHLGVAYGCITHILVFYGWLGLYCMCCLICTVPKSSVLCQSYTSVDHVRMAGIVCGV